MTQLAGGSFIVIGENIHATRVVLRSGARVVALPDGRPALPFTDESHAERLQAAAVDEQLEEVGLGLELHMLDARDPGLEASANAA